MRKKEESSEREQNQIKSNRTKLIYDVWILILITGKPTQLITLVNRINIQLRQKKKQFYNFHYEWWVAGKLFSKSHSPKFKYFLCTVSYGVHSIFFKRLFSCRPPCSGSSDSFGLPVRTKFEKYSITAAHHACENVNKIFNEINLRHNTTLYIYWEIGVLIR